jgi:hypothetical protein
MEAMKERQTNKQFGQKVNELFDIIESTPDWDKYVTRKTAAVIRTLIKTQSMTDTMNEFNMKYITVRSHILKAIERISKKDTEFTRDGQSKQAKELFELMETIPNWTEYVTFHEAEIALCYKDVKNFYEVGRRLGLKPGNIAGTLYGTTQKIGVIAKIKSRIPQTERRDIDKRRKGKKVKKY